MKKEKTASERLAEMIKTMSDTEAEKVLYLIEGTRIGEAARAAAESRAATV